MNSYLFQGIKALGKSGLLVPAAKQPPLSTGHWNGPYHDHPLDSLLVHNFLLLPQSAHLKLRTCVLPSTPTAGVARILSLTSGNQTHIDSVAPLGGPLIQDALLTELPQLWLIG